MAFRAGPQRAPTNRTAPPRVSSERRAGLFQFYWNNGALYVRREWRAPGD